MGRYDNRFYQLINLAINSPKLTSMNLGGISGSGGGTGGPIGGITGQLPQTKVAYDTTEAEISGFVEPGAVNASGVVVSGSLLDNLNHIRYRISTLETSGVATNLIIEDDGTVVASGVLIIDFQDNLIATDLGGSEVAVDALDEKSKVSSNDTTSNYLENKIVAGANVVISVLNEGGNEQLEIASSGGGGGGTAATWQEVLDGIVTDKFVAPVTTPISFEYNAVANDYAAFIRHFIAGGNIGIGRGGGALDLQIGRFTADDVPKSYLSTLVGGEGNKITENSDYSIIAGGFSTTIDAVQAGAFGTGFAVISGSSSAVVGGNNSQIAASAGNAVVLGGNKLLSRNPGEVVHGWGTSQLGDAQHMMMVVKGNTTSATSLDLTLTDGLEYPNLPDFASHLVKARIIARRTDTPDPQQLAAFELECIHHVDDTGLAAIVNPTKTIIQNGTGSLTWDVAFSGSNRNLFVRVTGEAAKTIRWVAYVDIVQVIG